MEKKVYICKCGKEFNNPQSFNGHKSHCKQHLMDQGKYDQRLQQQKASYKKSRETYFHNKEKRNSEKDIKQKQNLLNWIVEKHRCEKCGKVMTEKFGSGRFCSRACANSRLQTEEINKKRSKTVSQTRQDPKYKLLSQKQKKEKQQKQVENYNKNPNCCIVCGKALDFNHRNKKTCSEKCKRERLSIAGKKSAAMNQSQKRSVHEIAFYELCLKTFQHVDHNKPIFNGWDADIIIEDYQIAVLWNGPWHYMKLFDGQKCSLKQIQNRDRIKQQEIEKAGYICYIIKDLTYSLDDKIVLDEFNKLLLYIKNNKLKLV